MHDTWPVVTDFALRVTESQLPVTDFQLLQIDAFAAHLPALMQIVQCTRPNIADPMRRVTEVTDFVVNREVRHETSKIIDILFVFSYFSKLLSIAEKVSYFSYRSQFEAQEVLNG